MKLFIVTCIKEYQPDVTRIFKEANIHVFSATEVTGFKNNHPPDLLEEWFAAGDEQVDAVMLFSFTADEQAAAGIELIKKYNKQNETGFPVRAFIVPVEKSGY